jgi:hypothetical protein
MTGANKNRRIEVKILRWFTFIEKQGKLKVAVRWLTTLICNRDFPGLNVLPKT